MKQPNELIFPEVTVLKEDLDVLERVIRDHLDELMARYKGEYHHDLVIAGLSRIMLAFGRNIDINRDSSGQGYLVEIIDAK